MGSPKARISIHALREEGDRSPPEGYPYPPYFYPRPPRGGRPSPWKIDPKICYFYPRPPRGGRRGAGIAEARRLYISIHALREEGDPLEILIDLGLAADFYPRPPRGGRPDAFQIHLKALRFLSTPSARRATRNNWQGILQFLVFLSTPSARRATPAL